MHLKTTSLAILLAASVALAFGAITAGPVHAQCGNGPNDVPCENEKEKKVRRTEVPPTATSTPTPEPSTTPTQPPPTASPTATQTPLPPVVQAGPGEVVVFSLPLSFFLGLLILVGGVAAVVLAARFRGSGGNATGGDPVKDTPRETGPEFGGPPSGGEDVGASALNNAYPHGTPAANPSGSSVDIDAELDLVPDFHIEKEDVRVELSSGADLLPGHLEAIPIPEGPEGLGDLDLPSPDATKDTLAIEGDLADSAEDESSDASGEDSSDDPDA